MTFEEDFPSFKEYSSTEDWDELINWNEDIRGYDKEDIKKAMQEHCLDKQKVKEAIERIRFLIDCDPFAELLLKELGIND